MDERVFGSRRVRPFHEDDGGFTSVGMVLALLVCLSLIFTAAQVYRVNTASARVQDVADAAVGSLACCLMKTDGSVWVTGYNKYGQCGVHYATNRKGILSEWTPNGLNLLESSWARPE